MNKIQSFALTIRLVHIKDYIIYLNVVLILYNQL